MLFSFDLYDLDEMSVDVLSIILTANYSGLPLPLGVDLTRASILAYFAKPDSLDLIGSWHYLWLLSPLYAIQIPQAVRKAMAINHAWVYHGPGEAAKVARQYAKEPESESESESEGEYAMVPDMEFDDYDVDALLAV